MKKLMLAVALFSIVPALRAQQSAAGADSPQTAPQAGQQAEPQPASQNPGAQDQLPAAIRPGHPLDPADVDILTGKRDREIEAARQAAVLGTFGAYGEYGSYGDYYRLDRSLGAGWDISTLPLAPITNPFFFSRISPRGFGRRGFGRRH